MTVSSVFLYLKLQKKLVLLRTKIPVKVENSQVDISPKIEIPSNENSENKDKPITEAEFKRLMGRFKEPSNPCCDKFVIKTFNTPNSYHDLLLKLAEGIIFENMSIDDDMAWIIHYRCKKCKDIWELSPPMKGYVGYFKPVDASK